MPWPTKMPKKSFYPIETAEAWKGIERDNHRKKFLSLIPLAAFWVIWKEMTIRSFQGIASPNRGVRPQFCLLFLQGSSSYLC